MKYSLSEKISVILLWIALLLSIVSLLLILSIGIGHCENLPKGWWIEKHKLTNEYRWCKPSGYCGNATFQTKKEAIRDALKVYNFEKWQEDQKRKKQREEKNWQKVNIQGKIKVGISTTWQDDSAQTSVHFTCTKCGARLYVTSKDDPSVVADWKVYHDCKK